MPKKVMNPSNRKFTLEIELDAKARPEDVADTLETIAEQLNQGFTSGIVDWREDAIEIGHWTYDGKDHL